MLLARWQLGLEVVQKPLRRVRQGAPGQGLQLDVAQRHAVVADGDAAQAACSRQQLPLEPVLTTSNWSTLIGFVGHGGGLTVSGEVSIRQMVAAGTLRGVPIRDHGMALRDIELQTLAGRTLPHAAQRFLNYLKTMLPAGQDSSA